MSNEWKNSAGCEYRYRVTDGKGTVYGEQYTLTMRLTFDQMSALQYHLQKATIHNTHLFNVLHLFEGAILAQTKTLIPKGE